MSGIFGRWSRARIVTATLLVSVSSMIGYAVMRSDRVRHELSNAATKAARVARIQTGKSRAAEAQERKLAGEQAKREREIAAAKRKRLAEGRAAKLARAKAAKERKAAVAAHKRELARRLAEGHVRRRDQSLIMPEGLSVPGGFKVEVVRMAESNEGSWISLTKDDQGRLIISGQPEQDFFRVTLNDDGQVDFWERLSLPVSGAMGAVYAHDSLYLAAQGADGYGLYRCRDTDADDQYDQFEKLFAFDEVRDLGFLEHGPHGLAVGPDGKIYCAIGDRTPLPVDSPHSPHQHHFDDVLAGPRTLSTYDPSKKKPLGRILRCDPDGKNVETVVGGLRNPYDLDFNADGELFVFDNEAEWESGSPWFQPARFVHCVSGGEFGWRNFGRNYPEIYEDILPSAFDAGFAAPSGLASGKGTRFPERYQRAFFALDWTFGRIIAIHTQPNGASYKGTFETLIEPAESVKGDNKKPFSLTDLTVGKDGSLYFVVGGRFGRGCLYRLTYVGDDSAEPVVLTDEEGTAERALRHKLEGFHGREDVAAVNEAWPHLNSTDRFLRYAARTAIESQPVESWREKALTEQDVTLALSALLALTRAGEAAVQPEVQRALLALNVKDSDRDLQFAWLRTCGIQVIRHRTEESSEFERSLAERVAEMYPAADDQMNRELTRLMIAVGAPTAVEHGLARIAAAKIQQEQMFYIHALRNVPADMFTTEQRRTYLNYYSTQRPDLPTESKTTEFFALIGRKETPGASFYEDLTNAFWEIVAKLSDDQRAEIADVIDNVALNTTPVYSTPSNMKHFRVWTTKELEYETNRLKRGNFFAQGQRIFVLCQCVNCHRMGDIGGSIGPDLTTLSRRFTRQQILESIVDPSNVISEQFSAVIVATTDGHIHTGRIVDETADKIVLQPSPFRHERVQIARSDIESLKKSKISPMPEHLLDVLGPHETIDLLDYLQAGGDPVRSAATVEAREIKR